MTPKKRFFLGGGGALMPVLVSLLTIDIGAALASDSSLTTGNIVGLGIRYIILFAIGGIVAYLHEEESKPFKLFQLGMAAPALITSLITSQGIASNANHPAHNNAALGEISIIKSAYAEEEIKPDQIILAGGFLGEVLDGVSGGVYRKSSDEHYEKVNYPPTQSISRNVIDAAQPKELPTEKASKDPKEIEEEIARLKVLLKEVKATASEKNKTGDTAPPAKTAKQPNNLREQAPGK